MRRFTALDNLKYVSIRLFADDCILYRIIETPEDHQQLQCDLNSLMRWTKQ